MISGSCNYKGAVGKKMDFVVWDGSHEALSVIDDLCSFYTELRGNTWEIHTDAFKHEKLFLSFMLYNRTVCHTSVLLGEYVVGSYGELFVLTPEEFDETLEVRYFDNHGEYSGE